MIKINGIDLYSSCGFLPDSSRETSNSMERPNNPTEVFSHRWDNGVVEYDTRAIPGKEPRIFKLSGCLHAISEADYNLKTTSLDALVRVPKVVIYHQEIDKTVNAKFKQYTGWNRLTPIKGSSQIITKISMEFDELLGIEFQEYTVYSGGSSAVPYTATEVQALNAAVFTKEFIVNTGTTSRIINIVLQSDKNIISITDLDNSMFPTVQYSLKGLVTVAGVNFRVFSLELGSPYSINHRHKFIIS
jgi:hypothetical protein